MWQKVALCTWERCFTAFSMTTDNDRKTIGPVA